MEEHGVPSSGTVELEIFWPIYPLSLATLQFLKSFFPAPFESIVFSVMSRPQRYCVLDACRRPLKNQQRFHLKSVVLVFDTEPHPFRKWRPEICSSCYRRGLKLRKQMAAADRQDTEAGIDLDASVELGRGEEATPEPGLRSPSPRSASLARTRCSSLVRVVDAQGKNVVMRAASVRVDSWNSSK